MLVNRKRSFNKNSNLIFVLIDNNIASSGEDFVNYLRYMENVVFVGENTKGVFLVEDNMLYQLPNSKIKMVFGSTLFMGTEGENMDSKGIMPDIWVNSEDALDATLRLIRRYNLKK